MKVESGQKLPSILLIDNSVSVTGALNCALQQARIMKPYCRYVLVLPAHSTAINYVQDAGFEVHTLPMLELGKNARVLCQYPIRLVANALRLKKIARKEDATVLVINDYYNLLGAAVRLLGPGLRLLSFVRFQPTRMPELLNRLWLTAAYRFSDAVIAVSKTVFDQLPLHTKNRLLYDAAAFPEQHPAFSIATDNFTLEVLCLGNYIRGKGQDYALQAFALAYPSDPHLRLTFRGGDMGLSKNQAFLEELKETAAAKGLTEVVRFLPFAKDVEAAYKSADIFINCSESESFSLTCAEAAFYGVPTIASRCGGPEEIILHERTGLLVDNKDVIGFADALLRLAADPRLRSQFSKASRRFVRERFNVATFRTQLAQLLSVSVLEPVPCHE